MQFSLVHLEHNSIDSQDSDLLVSINNSEFY